MESMVCIKQRLFLSFNHISKLNFNRKTFGKSYFFSRKNFTFLLTCQKFDKSSPVDISIRICLIQIHQLVDFEGLSQFKQ
jgi:hypothetical protein